MVVRFGVDMAVSIKIMVSWVVTPCNVLSKCYCNAFIAKLHGVICPKTTSVGTVVEFTAATLSERS
jgi:hypothetical protein